VHNRARMVDDRVTTLVMSDETPIVEQGVVSMPDEEWEEARRRAAVIGPVAARLGFASGG
jgi:hypothetical protein